jgi:hypothetical protein
MSELSDRLNKSGVELPRQRTGPLWKGPESSDPQGGVTQGLLGRFLVCRERFRLLVIEGLKPADDFSHRLFYGNAWHVCEEALAANRSWDRALTEYTSDQCKQYRMSQEQIVHWYNVCKIQFPLYVEFWRKHRDVANRTPLLQEQVFDVPYPLPSGRTVRLRGKWDSVDLVESPNSLGVWLMENKTKGEVNEVQLRRQLTWDLQVMFYMSALQSYDWTGDVRVEKLPKVKFPLKGVRYNVIRRPLSGGAGTIRQHKPTKANPQGESRNEFYARLKGIIAEAPDTYFFRWLVTVTPADVEQFRRQCLDPVLESLCDWYEWVTTAGDNYGPKTMRIQGVDEPIQVHNAVHWWHPFGVRNPMDSGGSSDLDHFLSTGSTVGLTRTDELFGELR